MFLDEPHCLLFQRPDLGALLQDDAGLDPSDGASDLPCKLLGLEVWIV
jgi:hypothetical protein